MTSDGDDGADTTPLRRTRAELGWKVSQLIATLRRRASQTGVMLGSDKSLKTTISRHENGHVEPDADWRKLYRLAYGRTDDELGFQTVVSASDTPGPADDLRQQLATAQRVDMRVVQQMQQQVHQIRLLDRRLGASSLLEQTRSVITTLTELAHYSLNPSVRQALAAVLSDAGALAGWQALDVGAVQQAWGHYETAKTAAREADAPVLLAHAMGEQAYVLHDLGRITDALGLVQEAQKLAGESAPVLLLCWLHAVEAEVQAASADDRCRQALDRSAKLLPADATDPELPFITLNRAHHARWRGHCLARVGDGEAIDYLSVALTQMDKTFIRATAGLRCDLAQAFATRGELDEARKHLRNARLLANQVGSVRQRKRIMSLGLAA
ncbi:XRE family transcriptional regulator [Actinomadura xylanilytica]|uniref:XRE family transcriptional regulator n=1 Tax=Actinomadura xylanilytica TaxID=887459 RepID=UPI00255AF4D7|nr:XRE family transcriptional regulator [Actinomadura xylanilytica]MDL4777588.1 XRE family transcriptional regulator [Actinomadura xylanilytica]